MKSGITVEEANQLKKQLESDLLDRIKIFESETGFAIRDIDFQWSHSVGGLSEIVALFITCEL